jgi:hypothetical protein
MCRLLVDRAKQHAYCFSRRLTPKVLRKSPPQAAIIVVEEQVPLHEPFLYLFHGYAVLLI